MCIMAKCNVYTHGQCFTWSVDLAKHCVGKLDIILVLEGSTGHKREEVNHGKGKNLNVLNLSMKPS